MVLQFVSKTYNSNRGAKKQQQHIVYFLILSSNGSSLVVSLLESINIFQNCDVQIEKISIKGHCPASNGLPEDISKSDSERRIFLVSFSRLFLNYICFVVVGERGGGWVEGKTW